MNKKDVVEILKSLTYKKIELDDENLEISRVESKKGCVEFVRIFKGEEYKEHFHEHVDGKFYFLEGKGNIVINGNKIPYKNGSSFVVPKGMSHGFEVEEETFFISIQSQPILNDNGFIDLKYK
jgi:mannose-6-phosphate isomerase-like protein (cupin superfamily)